MITLREFLKIARHEHFRIYQPNRDCLIFESYFKVHSPYYFGKNNPKYKKGEYNYNDNYWDNNDYCQDFYKYSDDSTRYYDEETNYFLEEFGDYEVFSVESSGFKPRKQFKDKNGDFQSIFVDDRYRPDADYIDCFNIFIIPYSKKHHIEFDGCDRCWHSNLQKGKCIPDELDIECKKCNIFKEMKHDK